MNRHQLQELIQGELDGELSVAERADLARLLLQDPDARRLQGELRKTHQLLRDIAQAEPPPELRAAILAGPAQSGIPRIPGRTQYGWPGYRVAAVILGGLLIVGLSYLLQDGEAPVKDLQGSLSAAPQHQLSLRAEGVEVGASLKRNGETLRLELDVSTAIACEVIARVDGAKTSFVGSPGDARVETADGQVTVRPEIGSQAVVLEFSGAAPIQVELRSEGRLLAAGMLSASGQ